MKTKKKPESRKPTGRAPRGCSSCCAFGVEVPGRLQETLRLAHNADHDESISAALLRDVLSDPEVLCAYVTEGTPTLEELEPGEGVEGVPTYDCDPEAYALWVLERWDDLIEVDDEDGDDADEDEDETPPARRAKRPVVIDAKVVEVADAEIVE